MFLFSIPNLVHLNLDRNNFSGGISPDFHKLTRLGTLYFEGLSRRKVATRRDELRELVEHFNATKERLEVEEEHSRVSYVIRKISAQIMSLERQAQDIQEQHMKATQDSRLIWYATVTFLEELDIRNNQIQVLPDSFGMLTHLHVLHAEENPLEGPPRHIVGMGAEAVVHYMGEFVAKRDLKTQSVKTAKTWAPCCFSSRPTRKKHDILDHLKA